MVIGLCGVLVAHSDMYAAHHPHVIKIRKEQSFWQAYGNIIKQGVPWIIAAVGILHYRGVASKEFDRGFDQGKIDGVRGVYEHLGNVAKGFPRRVLKDQNNLTNVLVRKNPCSSGAVQTFRLCHDFVNLSYKYYCESLGYTQPPVLNFGEEKGD